MKMFRLSKIFLMAALTVVVMASSALAGSIIWYNGSGTSNTAVTVALEAMGSARNYTYSNGTASTVNSSTSVKILPTGNIVSGSILQISLTNGGFDGTNILVCANNGSANVVNTPVGIGTASANATSTNIVITTAVTSGNIALLTDNNSASNCATANAALVLRFQPVTSAAMVGMSYTLAVSSATYDSGGPVNIANVSAATTTAFTANNSSIDFLSAPANGSTFVGNTTTSNYANANIGLVNMNLGAVAGGTINAGLTSSAILTLQDSASWQGVRRVYLMNGVATACALANNSAINNAPSGTVPLNIPSSIWAGNVSSTNANTVTVCADVLGNATINPRTISGALNVTYSGTGAQNPGITSYNTLMVWSSNGYQGVVPYISADALYKTICMINNTNSSSAAVTVDVQTAESGASTTSLQAISLGTVSANGTKRIDLASTLTPYTYSGTTETAGTATTLTGVQSNDRYSARINVAAPPANVTVNCIQLDPAGSKRAVPVLNAGSTPGYLTY